MPPIIVPRSAYRQTTASASFRSRRSVFKRWPAKYNGHSLVLRCSSGRDADYKSSSLYVPAFGARNVFRRHWSVATIPTNQRIWRNCTLTTACRWRYAASPPFPTRRFPARQSGGNRRQASVASSQTLHQRQIIFLFAPDLQPAAEVAGPRLEHRKHTPAGADPSTPSERQRQRHVCQRRRVSASSSARSGKA